MIEGQGCNNKLFELAVRLLNSWKASELEEPPLSVYGFRDDAIFVVELEGKEEEPICSMVILK